jgi:hypothetical protein
MSCRSLPRVITWYNPPSTSTLGFLGIAARVYQRCLKISQA